MADFPLLGLCSDCLHERRQRVEAVTLHRGTSVCAACNDARQLDDRMRPLLADPFEARAT